MNNIGVVLVTYNRLNKLEIALEFYDKQIVLPDYILVLNNNSSDGTMEYLEEWKRVDTLYKKIVVHLPNNIGGSGGFYEGLKIAQNLESDWIWLSDDDAYPDLNAFKILSYNVKNRSNQVSAFCGSVISNNEIDTYHRRRLKRTRVYIKENNVSTEEYIKDMFEIDLLSFVGCALNKDVVTKIGLPEKNYFIYYDDSDYSYRLGRYGKIMCIPNIKITHDTTIEHSSRLSWKKYYSIRNKLISYHKFYPNRYMYTLCLYYYIKSLFRSKKEHKLTITAIKDALNKKTGMHYDYRPGWE